MANQYVNKVIIGKEVKLDLTADSVTPDKLAKGITAHDKTGAPITGTSTKDVDSTDATVAVAEMLDGKTAYARGAKLTGTMPNNGAVAGKITQKDGKYTIPGAKLTGTALTVTVEKTARQTAEVNVYEYIKLDGKAIYLVTASGTVADGKVMAYDGSAMFWSEKYKAYAYLVISNTELTKAEAAKKVSQSTATKTSIAYDGDVNMTGKIDVNATYGGQLHRLSPTTCTTPSTRPSTPAAWRSSSVPT